jgi:hypothetical protein
MQYLKDTKITGPKHHVSRLLKLFGQTYFGPIGMGEVQFELTHVFANKVYGGVSLVERPTIKREPLYVLVPNMKLDAVWAPSKNHLSVEVCEDGIEVRFGPASSVGAIHICNAVSIRIDRSVLYMCLDPAGRLVDESSNMGV